MTILTASGAELRELLRSCLAVPRWIDQLASAAPFADGSALLAAAEGAAAPLTGEEIEQALADHPRIGARAQGTGRSAAFSRAEQQAPDVGDSALAAALADGNAAYEERFGRVFLIRAAGRTRAEILTELNRRITLEPETELAIVGDQLRQIALLRLRRLLEQSSATHARSHITTHVLDVARGIPAGGIEVTLERRAPAPGPGWREIGRGVTDTDGRIRILGPAELPADRYRVTFATGAYFAGLGTATFYPEVSIVIDLADTAAHYHVPVLLSPFGYSTYRGS